MTSGGALTIKVGGVTLRDMNMHATATGVCPVVVSGGTLTVESGSYSSTLYRSLIVNSYASVTIQGGTFLTEKNGQYNVEVNSYANVTITGGQFYTPKGGYPLVAKGSSALTISGGLFTFADSIESEEAVKDLYPSTFYQSSGGGYSGAGVWIETTGSVRISGGVFYSGKANQALRIRSASTDVVISGEGSFYGYRALQVEGSVAITNGNFYESYGTGTGYAGHHLIDIVNASAVVNIYGGNFNSDFVSSERVAANSIIRFTAAGTVNIYGGIFTMTNMHENAAVINMPTAGKLYFGGGTFPVDGQQIVCTGARLTKNKWGALINQDVEGATINIDDGIFHANGQVDILMLQFADAVTVTGGTFTTKGAANAFRVAHPKASLQITGGRFVVLGDDTVTDGIKGNAAAVKATAGSVMITGGSFEGASSYLLKVAIKKGEGSFEIKGGTFTLQESSVTAGGSILRTDVAVIPQAHLGQFYDPTEMYYVSEIDILLTGGLFVDDRSTNQQIIDATLGTSCVIVDGAVLLSKYAQSYVINVNDAGGTDVPMSSTAVCKYNGKSYYCYTADGAENTDYAPVMDNDVAIAVTPDYEGIRFTSYIPARVVSTLPAGYSFGTLIAPADYVLAAGGFTHALLGKWQEANPSYGTAFVDVPAKNSIVETSDGSIAFSAALISIQNYTRNLAAVTYVLVDGIYYYSDFDIVNNASTMAHVAKMAYTATVSVPDETHMVTSLYNPYGFTSFAVEEPKILKSYCGYEHTYDVSTVTPSTTVTVGSDASTNLKTAASTTLKNALLAKGYTSSGAEILVGNTGKAETATALSEIEGEGYYIGVINGKIVIVGTTNALTMQALSVFQNTILPEAGDDGCIVLSECISSHVKMLSLNSDTHFCLLSHA